MARFQELEVPQQGALIFGYKDIVQFAPAYTDNGTLSATLAIKIYDALTVGYSYETQAQNNGAVYQKGAHEIILAYSFLNKKAGQQREEKRLKELDEKFKEFDTIQLQRDAIEDSVMRNQQNQDERTKVNQKNGTLDSLNEALARTQMEMDELKKQLMKSKTLKKGFVTQYSTPVGKDTLASSIPSEGYYIVLASVKQRKYNAATMEQEYLSKGYKRGI